MFLRRMVALGTAALMTASLPAGTRAAGKLPASQGQDKALRKELIRMGKEDQRHRDAMTPLLKQGLNDPEVKRRWADLWAAQDEIDRRNMARLAGILAEKGWPGYGLVGRKAAGAAFLILQHAGLEEQKKYFPLLKAAAALGDASPSDTAMMEDRILMREGKKQVYGTQLATNSKTGKLELWPVENPGTVDARRKSVGLPPLAEELKYFGLEAAPPPGKE